MSGGGTIDLDWSSLTPDFAERLVGLLNTSLSSVTRPSFIGPISVSSFEFGSNAPDLELIDVRDIYPDFLEDDEDDSEAELGDSNELPEQILDDFEWVSRREGAPSEPIGDYFSSPYNHLPPHLRPLHGSVASGYRPRDFVGADRRSNLPSIQTPRLAGSMPNLSRVSSVPILHAPLLYNIPSLGTAAAINSPRGLGTRPLSASAQGPSRDALGTPFDPNQNSSGSSLPPSPPNTEQPDLQLHFRIDFESNLRLMINTSLQINYPSPMIMALPIKLCVTGLALEGELVVAYEGSRRRFHMCFLDELASHGGGPIPAFQPQSVEHEDEDDVMCQTPKRVPPSATSSRFAATPSKASPAGVRLLPSIILESEIGQEDKHVLRNVARVERFIQDVIRKTIEDELVYPNFQTIVLADNSHDDNTSHP